MIDVLVMTWALTLTRVGTFIYFLPLLGGPAIPRTVKVGLAMALTGVFYNDAVAGLARCTEPGSLGDLGLVAFVECVGPVIRLGFHLT